MLAEASAQGKVNEVVHLSRQIRSFVQAPRHAASRPTPSHHERAGPRDRREAREHSIICEQLDDLATGEDCLLRALESLEADPRTTTALKSALWPVCARLCQYYHSTRNTPHRGGPATVHNAHGVVMRYALVPSCAAAYHAYEASVSWMERALLRDLVPSIRLPAMCWLLADAYMRKGVCRRAFATFRRRQSLTARIRTSSTGDHTTHQDGRRTPRPS